jgi:hypothetical protein
MLTEEPPQPLPCTGDAVSTCMLYDSGAMAASMVA